MLFIKLVSRGPESSALSETAGTYGCTFSFPAYCIPDIFCLFCFCFNLFVFMTFSTFMEEVKGSDFVCTQGGPSYGIYLPMC